ncbi:topology modulation protein [Bacillus sp. FJAT-27264]|uniref:DNA topology modulation protein n=1 Tax=Paenibacillus sp. (strain DSM 101736 / FJAT-27264) TaxID=1850362 RepID=UPI000807ED95|nr:DNA topology modulation protein [Bacillus sp. FJAT-27264]OBZ18912.1 topology modulation protein [Bacillus sp. FJAT-27264]
MNKIAIIGSGGSGKSTLAKKLGAKLMIDVYHLDSLFWKPNWVGVPKDEQIIVQNDLVKKQKLIINRNYGGTMEIRLNTADTIIFLDIPRTIYVFRVFKRIIKYRNKRRPDMGAGCEERFSIEFFKWIWEYPKTKKPGILISLEDLSKEKVVIILKSPKEVKQFLEKQNNMKLST